MGESVTHYSNPELTLLLTVARVELGCAEQDVLKDLLAGPIGWDYLLELASRHGLEPLLFLHLHQHAAQIVPQHVMHALRANSGAIARCNLILAAKLQEISTHLHSRGIKHISYKGPLLAHAYYGDCTLRESHDLDIIVPPRELTRTRDALEEIGFRDKYGLRAAQQRVSFRFGFEHPFTSAGGIDLDLHCRVVQKFKSRSLDMAGIWERVETARLFDGEIPTFCPEDSLVALCLHAGHHGWMQLSHLCDIAQLLLAHSQLDWKIVKRHLGDSNTRRIVYLSLYLARLHWQIQIPQQILTSIAADPYVVPLAHRIETDIWPSLKPTLTTSSLRWLLARSAGEDFGDRLRLLIGSVFYPAIEDFEAFRLPMVLVPIYPGLRVWRLACGYATSRIGKSL